MGDNKMKIGIMAGVLVALVAAFFIVFVLKGNKQPTSPQATMPMASQPGRPAMPTTQMPTPGKPGAPAHPNPMAATGIGKPPPAGNAATNMTKLAGNMTRPAPGNPRPGGKPPIGQLPGAPTVPQQPAIATPVVPLPAMAQPIAAVFDPFLGGPKPPPPPPPPPPPGKWPQLVMATTLPAILPQKSFVNSGPFQPTKLAVEPPVGRMAGWIFNSNAQIVAIFEDADGITYSVRVGDKVGNLTAQTITPEYMVMVDENGVQHKLKLQGLDSYSGKSRTVNVVATPAAANTPTWNNN